MAKGKPTIFISWDASARSAVAYMPVDDLTLD